ncbi:MAG: methyltransferase domain-containing protein [Bacteroidetes bacterium]|jgi:2-polyprenyl-3-methyl-5-hydroxy-6-metoxy-1,4-benzoquinol methylase|nr:methyltransferase domain-containing protein [Bacteroidota bacterium]
MHPVKEKFNFDQCENCDYVFLNPRVEEKELHRYYTPYYLPYRGAEVWGKYKSIVAKSQHNQDLKKLRCVTDNAQISKNSLILDIGCGRPSFLKACHDKLSCQTMGIDFNDDGWANQEAIYQNIDLKIGEISDLSNQLKPDVITMWHYLEHDYKPEKHLKHLRSISKPETKLIIEVPNFDSVSRQKFGKDWAGWHTPRHISLFSPNNIKLLLQNSGWKTNDILCHGTMDPYLLFWMSKMQAKNIDWSKNMEDEFLNFLWGKFKFLPQQLKEKQKSLGIMTVIASPAAQ